MLALLAEGPEEQAGRRTILLVEDDILERLTTADELRGSGFVVIEAANADEALAILQTSPQIDLVITDVRMPGSVDGIGLAVAMRSSWPHLKVIVVSAEAPSWPSPGLADAFIGKPYDPARLVARARDVLAGDGR
jgi:CheY-like chemotaxis protein